MIKMTNADTFQDNDTRVVDVVALKFGMSFLPVRNHHEQETFLLLGTVANNGNFK